MAMPSYSIVHGFAGPQELIVQLQQAWNKQVIFQDRKRKADTWQIKKYNSEPKPTFQGTLAQLLLRSLKCQSS